VGRLAIIAALLIALTLNACGPSAQDANETAQTYCITHGGVKHLEYFADHPWYAFKGIISSYNVECKDGSQLE
jgi:hypothetical protein